VGSTTGTAGTDGRLSDAARLRRLDTALPCASLDRLARAAAHQVRCDRAQISLLAADRQVVAGSAGPAGAHTFCRIVLDTDAPLLVSDAHTDDRVAGHPAVGDGVIAYAGFPLRGDDGRPLGVFCVLHDQPRDWEPRDLLLVEDLAAAAETEINLRAEVRAQAAAVRRLRAERHRVEIERELRLAVAGALADATSAEEAAGGALAAVVQALGWAFGEFWQCDEETGRIARVGHWISPTHDLSAVTADRAFSVAHGVGLAGNIWATGTVLWASEVADDPRLLMRSAQIRAAGLHSTIGVPVRSADRILGVLLLFSAHTEKRDPAVLELLDGVCAQLGRYFERRRAEDLALALAAARRDFDRVIEQVNDYVWTVEVRPDGSIHPVYGSPGGVDVVAGKPTVHEDFEAAMNGRVHPEDRQLAGGLFGRVLAGEPAENEVRMIGADGMVRWVWTRAVPRREGDRLLVDGISTDVTDRRLLAEQRERLLADQRAQNDQLRRLDRLKDELVALVSHELRNPLAAIRNYAEELLADPALTGDHRHLTEVIDKHSAHMQHLVDDLLDLARLEAGKLHIDPRPASAARLVRDAAESQRSAAAAKALLVDVQVPADLPVRADPVRLRQVLDNLLSNAVKYTPPGGTVTVTAAGRDGEVVLTVTDTGIGIPAEQYPQLFDRFFRASNAIRQGIKGTGLGLAITKAIVEAHGGRVTAAPGDGGGCTFEVTLPAQE
jgi:signal transduction histidine kinase/GAF domain-containing protein